MLDRVRKNLAKRLEPPPFGILDEYVLGPPGDQNAVDLFRGEWSSALPREGLVAGNALLFEDARLQWFVDSIGGVAGRTVLELGPLEGGHSYMMQNGGADSVLAIEANTRAFVKCLIVKELFGLDRVSFRLGDFKAFLQSNSVKFDICLASGVLYHMTDPVDLLRMITGAAEIVYIWTHYCDPDKTRYDRAEPGNTAGFKHTRFVREYGKALEWKGFCGGSSPYACWLSRDDILNALRHFGFEQIRINFEQPDHQHGPAFALYAAR
jgi:hypothetical protein